MANDELKMSDVVADVISDFDSVPDTEKIKSLATLAREQIAIEEDIAQLEKNLIDMKDQLKMVSEVKIPELFNELGLDSFKLNNGMWVKVNPYYTAKITDEKAYDWLDEHGHGDMVKGEFIIHYRKDTAKDLEAFRKMAAAMGFTVADKFGVHPMTLKAFVRSQIESGNIIDRELFNVYTGFKTKIGR